MLSFLIHICFQETAKSSISEYDEKMGLLEAEIKEKVRALNTAAEFHVPTVENVVFGQSLVSNEITCCWQDGEIIMLRQQNVELDERKSAEILELNKLASELKSELAMRPVAPMTPKLACGDSATPRTPKLNTPKVVSTPVIRRAPPLKENRTPKLNMRTPVPSTDSCLVCATADLHRRPINVVLRLYIMPASML